MGFGERSRHVRRPVPDAWSRQFNHEEPQGCLAHKKDPPPRILLKSYTEGPTVVLKEGTVSHERGTPAAESSRLEKTDASSDSPPAAVVAGERASFRLSRFFELPS